MKRLALCLFALIVLGTPAVLLAILYHLPLDLADKSPRQPIAFSHQLHAGEYEIDCLFCHRGARVSPVAGVPPMSTCEACHLYIGADRPQVQVLMQQVSNGEPVEWSRVHILPDHVYFPHMMHLAADIGCSDCHGDVAGMENIQRQFSPKMGWCLNCHRKHEASIDCWTCHI